MRKIVRLTESDLVRLVRKVILAETEGELESPYWLQIKKTLIPLGFKFKTYNEEGGLQNYLYSGKNPFKDYQHGTLERGDIFIKYPYTEVEGGPIETDKIRVMYDNTLNPQIVKSMAQKYKNSIIPSGEGMPGDLDFVLKVKDVNSVISLVKDLLSIKK